MAADLKNILIIKPSSLGDIVLSLPALSALRRNFPDARISWFVRPEFAPILQNHPHITEIIHFDRKFLAQAWFNPRALASLVSLIRRLRRSKFDAVFDFQGLFRTASLAWLAGCKRRIGMANARELAHIFYTLKVRQNEDCAHLVDYYLKIIQTAGAKDLSVEFILPEDDAAADSAGRLLSRYGIEPGNFAILVPGSAHSDKCWPIERFAALAEKISSQFHIPFVVAGTASERSVVAHLETLSKVPVINLTGRTSLNELLALLRAAKLVVSNDTGPGHIAAALGIPLVMLFGRSNPARVAPYGRKNCVVAVEPYSRGLAINSNNPKHDITAVTVEDVFQKVCEQLNP